MMTRSQSKKQSNASESNTPAPPKSTRIYYARTYHREHTLDEPFMTHEGKMYHVYHQRDFELKKKLEFVILFIYKFIVFENQSQILCDILSLEIDGKVVLLEETIVLLKDCKIWQWYPATIGNNTQKKLIKMQFVPKGFFRKLEFPNKHYITNFKINEKAYHMYFIGTSKTRQHLPVKVIIEKIFVPPGAAMLYFDEFEIKLKQYGRKHNGTRIGGGRTCDMLLNSFGSNEPVKRWKITNNNAILNAARKSIMNGNIYFVNTYCADFKELYLDLDEMSAFFAKPEKYESQKNCSMIGFDGIYSHSLLYNVIMNALNLECLYKRKPETLDVLNEITIKATPSNLIIFGNDCIEYVSQYGVFNYLQNDLKIDLFPQKTVIEWTIPSDILENKFDLHPLKTNKDLSEYHLESGVTMIYHRQSSKIMVRECKWSLKSKESIELGEQLMEVDE